MLELRSLTRLGELLARTRRTEEARSLLRECYETFEEGFGLPDLVAARALLDRLDGDARA